VGTSWKWKTDPADEIVAEAIRLHTNLVKELKGVPGVTEERFQKALKLKHCALSLVGEPIMYPQINELISELHSRRISTFLVTNAQLPEAIRTLDPVTQLYVSVDAGSPEALKKTDRPLFKDFWERYIASFEAIREKKQRTVYRLTLVKEYNMAEDEEVLNQYADLVRIGEPDFIEIKAVTFCGTSDDKDALTMKNVPWHEEVVKFSQALTNTLGKRGIGQYALACEHKHSCSILIAKEKFKVDGIWHTWIDYDKFADLALSGRKDFRVDEYWAPTPSWAVYGAEERGFDPEQVRHYHRASRAAKAERATIESNQ
jgi:tRNA wybutosine-synthesizing protein 1